VLIEERRPQAVVDHRVDQLRVPEPGALPPLRQDVGGVRHRLHPSGDGHLDLARPDHLVGHRDRGHAGQAHLVDRDRRYVLREPGADRCLQRGDLAGAGLQDVTHDRVVDLLAGDTGTLDGGPDRLRAELDRLEVRERTPELPGGCSGARDDHGTGGRAHGSSVRRPIVEGVATGSVRRGRRSSPG
jgi:hypothetical protein